VNDEELHALADKAEIADVMSDPRNRNIVVALELLMGVVGPVVSLDSYTKVFRCSPDE
jgi:hypothetical protein